MYLSNPLFLGPEGPLLLTGLGLLRVAPGSARSFFRCLLIPPDKLEKGLVGGIFRVGIKESDMVNSCRLAIIESYR